MGDGEVLTDYAEAMLADAERAVAGGRLDEARVLAQAALVLRPGDERGERILARATGGTDGAPELGERRQLTVMFIDVEGSTALSSTEDPEVVRDVLRAYQGACEEVVWRFGGQIGQYIGDGVVAFFGYPVPHEDDPRRAVSAGLELVEAMTEVAVELRRRHGLSIEVRIAVHTGLVVRAEMGSADRRFAAGIVGETPNLAARLQQYARPGTVVISDATYDLVHPYFDLEPIGAVQLRGVPRPVEAYIVTAEAAAPPVDLGTSTLVGRTEEQAELMELWRTAVAGGHPVAFVVGERGIGKTSLLTATRAEVVAHGGTQAGCACSSFHGSTHLYPIRRLIEEVCELDGRDPPAVSLPRLRAALEGVGQSHLVGLFADLLGFPPDDDWSPPEVDGMQLREMTLAALVEWVAASARSDPVVVVVDDIQWADPSTIELLGRVIDARIPGLMLLLGGRDGFVIPWGAPITTIAPRRLTGSELHRLALASAEGQTLTRVQLDEIIARSDGVPLLFEELLRAAGTTDTERELSRTLGTRFDIPASLLDPLLARLAAPGIDLPLAQLIATIGQQADREVLELVTGVRPDELDERLAGLIDAGIIDVVGGEHVSYKFHHHLMGELAYETQLLPARRRHHAVIADVLMSIDIHGVPGDAGAIAYHLEHADRIPEAVAAYVRAAHGTQSRGAAMESTRQLEHALTLLDRIADERQRAALELTIRQARGIAAVATWGYTSPQAVEDFQRCTDLCEVLGPAVEMLPSLVAMWSYSIIHGDIDRAEEIIVVDRRRLKLGPDVLPEDAGWGSIHMLRGDYPAAVRELGGFLHSEYAERLEELPDDWPLPNDPVAGVCAGLGLCLWVTGRPVEARQVDAELQRRAAGLAFPHGPFSAAYAKLVRIIYERMGGYHDLADALTREVREIADRHGFLFFSVSGAAHAALGEAERVGTPQALGALESSVISWRMLGMAVWDPWVLNAVARVCLTQGQHDKALGYLADAQGSADRTGAQFMAAETRRLVGEVRLAAGDGSGVDDLAAAAALAHEQGALIFELRAMAAWARADRAVTPDLRAVIERFPDPTIIPEVQAIDARR